VSELEALLLLHIRAAGIPEPVQQFRFHPVRRWRADFAWPDAMLLVEVDGATWSRGRHTRGRGYERDCEKVNAATLLGWRVLRFTRQQVESGYAIQTIEQALEQAT
jgi:very-short-patch-repair endonuclease